MNSPILNVCDQMRPNRAYLVEYCATWNRESDPSVLFNPKELEVEDCTCIRNPGLAPWLGVPYNDNFCAQWQVTLIFVLTGNNGDHLSVLRTAPSALTETLVTLELWGTENSTHVLLSIHSHPRVLSCMSPSADRGDLTWSRNFVFS